MDHPERSSHLFTLAAEFGIPLDSIGPFQIARDSFHTFCDRYLQWSKERDVALCKYLTSTSKSFRCYLPFNNRTYTVASQVVWYLDEIIAPDPLIGAIGRLKRDGTDKSAGRVLGILRLLSTLREAIDCGYVLLADDLIDAAPIDEKSDGIQQLSNVPQVVQALDRAVRFGLEMRPASTGEMCAVYEAQLDNAGAFGWYIPKPVTGMKVPPITIGVALPPTTAEALAKVTGNDPYAQIRDSYSIEIAGTLSSVDVAARLGAAALFDREVDDVILSAAEATRRRGVANSIAAGVKLVLPYLDGVPPERLLDLRAAIPDAFREFRGRMSEIVMEAMKDEPEEGIALARLRIERELSGSAHALDTEMAAVSKKTRLLGYAAIIPAIGVLAGSMIGIGSLELIAATAVGGVGLAVKAAAESIKERTRARVNPFYFVWEARQRVE